MNNNWNFNGGNGGNGFYNGNGYVGSMYNQHPQMRPQPKNTQPLTKEQQNALIKKAPKFSTTVDEVDLLRAWCTHRNNNGSALVSNNDGTYTCSICGETIKLVQYTEEQAKEITDAFINLIQITKVFYSDIPEQVAKDMYQILPLCARIPMLYKLAFNNYERYYADNGMNGMNNVYMDNSYNAWNSFDNFTGGSGMGQAFTPNLANQQEAYMRDPRYAGNGGMMNNMNGNYPNGMMNNFTNQQNMMLNGNNQQQSPFFANGDGMNGGYAQQQTQQDNGNVIKQKDGDNKTAKTTVDFNV